MKRIVILLLTVFLLGHPTGAGAQNITFEAAVNSTTVEVNSKFQLTLTATGTQSVPLIRLPDMEAFDSQYVGPSTRISIVNGQYSSSIAYMYSIHAKKKGKYQIPAISVELEGEVYSTDPIDIEVVDASTFSSYAQNQSAPALSLQDKIFIVLGTPLREAYLNERIPVTIKLFVNGVSVKNIEYPKFEHLGFTVDEYQEPTRYQQVIGGVRYEVVEFKTFVYPTRTGDLTLGPTQLICNVIFKSRQSRSRSPFDDFFDDDVFSGFFQSYEVKSITLESADLGLKIFPLPKKDQPQDFSGAVGSFDFDVSVSPQELKVGDPITLRMEISGDGNLKVIDFPQLEEKRAFKTYDPQVRIEKKSKLFEQVVIPKNENIKAFPALRFSYFDVVEQKYKTLVKGPFPLSITKLAEEGGTPVVGLDDQEQPKLAVEEQLGSDIVFIKSSPGKFQRRGARIYHSVFFYGLLCVFLGLWTGGYVFYRIKHRLKTDQVYARRLQAPRYARKGLAEALGFLQKRQQRQFYDALFKALQNYFSHKFHLPAGTITLQKIEALFEKQGIRGEILDKTKNVLNECEAVRYASAELEIDKMKVSLTKAKEIIDAIERS